MLGVDWDDPLPDALETKVLLWVREVDKMSKAKIPRNLISDSKNNYELHVFSGDSIEAFEQ